MSALEGIATPVRSVRAVPRRWMALLAGAFAAQLAWHAVRPGPQARASDLPPAPSLAVARLAAFGEETVLAKLMVLWLQAYDDQPGVSIPFAKLDYRRVEAWLGLSLDLDPRGEYPLLAAARLYGAVPVPAKERRMYDFVYRRFREDPNRRWPWLAHAALMAKHRLHDLALALRYARAITEYATGPGVPAWARDMSALLLEDLGEYESAYVLVRALIDSGRVTDPGEIRFLRAKLAALARERARHAGRKSDGNSTGR